MGVDNEEDERWRQWASENWPQYFDRRRNNVFSRIEALGVVPGTPSIELPFERLTADEQQKVEALVRSDFDDECATRRRDLRNARFRRFSAALPSRAFEVAQDPDETPAVRAI